VFAAAEGKAQHPIVAVPHSTQLLASSHSLLLLLLSSNSSLQSALSPSFAQPTAALDTKHTGIGLALYTAILACLGGFSGPVIIGTMVQRLGSFSQATIAMGAILCAAGLLMAGLAVWEKWGRKEKGGSSAVLGDSAVESRSRAASAADKGVASV
jgi:hypothetical protein